jgi:uncharacterized membrane protein YdjX (TVP38/TMEM64 family)
VTSPNSETNASDGQAFEPSAPSVQSESSPRLPVRCLAILGLVLIGLIAYAIWKWVEPLWAFFGDQEQIRAWLADFGPLAPILSIVINTAQVLLAPIPGQVIGFANGYLFGVFWGTVYSLVGVMLGTALAMVIGRLLGRPVVERIVSPEYLDRWDHLATRRGPIFLFLVFLLPLLPDDIVAFATGLSSLSIPYALTLAAIGRLPGLIVSSWIGAHASTLSPAGWVIVGAATLALAVVVLRYREQLETSLLRLAERVIGHQPDGSSPPDRNGIE